MHRTLQDEGKIKYQIPIGKRRAKNQYKNIPQHRRLVGLGCPEVTFTGALRTLCFPNREREMQSYHSMRFLSYLTQATQERETGTGERWVPLLLTQVHATQERDTETSRSRTGKVEGTTRRRV
ncbi:hypothetical protein BRADI_4g21717v3 [Brachypodium distachyon]|uniref:Uncharacterized protein n=1 Tax=Brachypodium distachyon TaxID=15368 RepID=A0A0Q3L8E6_BRADI|nr:hypothetical protein BRADI_4g21717v3 [Brachypodium distachyon]